MQAPAHTVPAKQHDAEEACLKEEGSQHLIGKQWASDSAGEVGKTTPVGTELVGHDQAGNHPHTEVHGEDLRPEVVKVTIDLLMGPQPKAF